jgi:hypothetical protein
MQEIWDIVKPGVEDARSSRRSRPTSTKEKITSKIRNKVIITTKN